MKVLKKLGFCALAAALAALSLAGLAEARGNSTPREREKAVRLAQRLEANPLSDDARESRRWLTMLLVGAPDLKVDLCPELLGGTPAERKRLPPEVVAQLMYSGAAFAIEHPDQAGSAAAVYQAGLLGALRVYEAILAKQPTERSAALDALLARREAGTLDAYVAEAMTACPTSPPA